MSIVRTAFVVAIVLAVTTWPLAAQNVTALKTGEETTGMTKQCYYTYVGNKYTKTFKSTQLCPLSIVVASPTSLSRRDQPNGTEPRSITAFKSGEEITGMTKQCYYSFGANKYTKTIEAVQLCPLRLTVAIP